jgi:hypothetical protein
VVGVDRNKQFDYISDHIDQCLKESLKGTQNEIITISNECKTLKKKYRRQRAMLHETLEVPPFMLVLVLVE